MKPSLKYALIAILLIACVFSIHRCQRRMGASVRPELSLYHGLGAAAAAELSKRAEGKGPWLVLAVDPASLPRYAAMVDAFKDEVSGEVIWHFVPDEKSLGFQQDGWGLGQLREALGGQSGIKGIVILGGSLRPGGLKGDAIPPVLVAGPMPRDVAASALTDHQLAAAIVYLDSPSFTPGASPAKQFNASFEILNAPQ